jgi:diguanylate cyclase (GGDEF)-like protein
MDSLSALSTNSVQRSSKNFFSGEFKDVELEVSFRRSMQSQTTQQLRIALFVTSALFMMFILFDYFLLGLTTNFYILSSMRVTVALASLLLAVSLRFRTPTLNSSIPLNLVCFLLVTSQIFIAPLRPETVFTQITAVVAITLALYLFLPNRFRWTVSFSIYLAAGFLLVIHALKLFELPGIIGSGLALIMANVVGMLTASRLNRLQRAQFTALLAERDTNEKLQKEIEERQRLEKDLRHLAQTDDLTGLNNRRWFFELAEQELRHTRRMGTPLGLCMLDIDHFKAVNDLYGHAAGDQVLKIVANLCRQELRASDIIGRFGGEEFVIALPDSDLDATCITAERLRTRLAQSQLPGIFKGLSLTMTAGVTQISPAEASLEPALLRADHALYTGKSNGRNTVVVAEHRSIEDILLADLNHQSVKFPSDSA